MASMRRRMELPSGSTSVPISRGWRGIVVSRVGKEYDIGWECEHTHSFRDTAELCAGRAYRRWWRTGERPE